MAWLPHEGIQVMLLTEDGAMPQDAALGIRAIQVARADPGGAAREKAPSGGGAEGPPGPPAGDRERGGVGPAHAPGLGNYPHGAALFAQSS